MRKADSSKVEDMHEMRAGKMGYVIGEGSCKVWSKVTPKLRTEEFKVNVFVDAH